jgi:xylitol oxidase
VRIALDIEPTFDVRQDVFTGVTWSSLLENFDAITSSAYSVSVFTSWVGEDLGTVWLKSRADAAAPPVALFDGRASAVDLHPLPDMPAEFTTKQVGVAGPWNERLAHFRLEFTPSSGEELQTEYLVPRRHAVAAIEVVRSLSDRVSPHLHITELRTMAADNLWLSGAYGTDAVGIHFTWKKEPEAVLPLLPVLEAALEPFEPRPHWGKLFSSVRRDLYPRLDDFVALASRMDPTGKFRNDYLDRHVFDRPAAG